MSLIKKSKLNNFVSLKIAPTRIINNTKSDVITYEISLFVVIFDNIIPVMIAER